MNVIKVFVLGKRFSFVVLDKYDVVGKIFEMESTSPEKIIICIILPKER